jgi:hypothetical protein
VQGAVLITADRVLQADADTTPTFDLPAVVHWGTLHDYALFGTGYSDVGSERSWIISLYYNDKEPAAADAGELVSRLKSYIFNTHLKQAEKVPLTSIYEVGEPVVKEYPGGATLTVKCRYLTENIRSNSLFTLVVPGRDLLFLVCDPASYVATPPAPSSAVLPPASQGPLTLEEAEKQFKKTGSALVDTLEKASRLAGYQVATPSFIPEGFVLRDIDGQGGVFDVHQPTFPAPNAPVEVAQHYSQNTDPKAPRGPFFILTQSTTTGDVAGGTQTDIEINGHPGKRSLITSSGNNPVSLGLSWREGKVLFMLQGTLQSPLDEATLLKVAESVSVK